MNIKSRKLNTELVHKFKIEHSSYDKLLKYISIDSALRMELYTGGKAQVFYKTVVALTIGARSFATNKNVFVGGDIPEEFDAKMKVAIDNPRLYFQVMKREIDRHLVEKHIDKQRCSAVHKVAAFNQLDSDRFMVVAMQYVLTQKELLEKRTNNTYDILAIDKKLGSVVIFNIITSREDIVQQMQTAIANFERNFRHSEYRNIFAKIIETDIKNIVADKNTLGLLNKCSLPTEFTLASAAHLDLKFVFCIDETIDRAWQMNFVNQVLQENNIPTYYQVKYVDIDDIPKLK